MLDLIIVYFIWDEEEEEMEEGRPNMVLCFVWYLCVCVCVWVCIVVCHQSDRKQYLPDWRSPCLLASVISSYI